MDPAVRLQTRQKQFYVSSCCIAGDIFVPKHKKIIGFIMLNSKSKSHGLKLSVKTSIQSHASKTYHLENHVCPDRHTNSSFVGFEVSNAEEMFYISI